MFFRMLFTVFGMRPVDRKLATLIPYFQYEIGPYSTDYRLHFRRQPSWGLYKNEIFSKLHEFTGYDITRYLNFHYEPYADKTGFLQFMRFETDERIRLLGKRLKDHRIKLEMVLAWVNEQERTLNKPLGDAAPGEVRAGQPDETEMAIVEAKLNEVTKSYAGRIVVSDERRLDRIIQLLLLLRDLQSPGKPIWPLFSQFSTTDMAAILRQFEIFRDMKVNTIQKRIMDCNKDLRPAEQKTAQLIRALNDFFY